MNSGFIGELRELGVLGELIELRELGELGVLGALFSLRTGMRFLPLLFLQTLMPRHRCRRV